MHSSVIVIGGGVVGLSAAIAMSQRGFEVTLLEAGSLALDNTSSPARVYAINRASQDLFQSIDVWSRIPSSKMSPYRHMHVWDAHSQAHIDFDARMIGADSLGYMLEESVIKAALLEKIGQLDITLISNCKITGVEVSAEDIRVKEAQRDWRGDLLLVADGALSSTRDLLKVPVTSWSYHQKAIVATVRTTLKHQHTAYQVFHKTGPLAFLPMVNPYESSIVWSTTPIQVDQLMNLSDDAFGVELTNAFASKLGATQVISKRHQFSLQMRHVQRYSGSRWILMGDAAHTIHPLAGLGLNVGLADLATWLQLIDCDRFAAWSLRDLSRYQRQRKHALWQTIALMEGLNLLFTNTMAPITLLRGVGLNLCNRLLPLKRLMIAHVSS